MPICRRRRVNGKPCRREAAEWPGQWQGIGQPTLAWPDLPDPVACWSHLSEAERAMCLEARKRHQTAANAAWAERAAQEAAARRAAGIPDPEPYVDVPLPPRCADGCISIEADWHQRHPSQYQDFRDGAAMTCANCGGYVCVACQRNPVDNVLMFCDPCGDKEIAIATDALGSLRKELNQLVDQIVQASGRKYPIVQARLNRAMGVSSRDQAHHSQLEDGIAAAERWLRQLAARDQD